MSDDREILFLSIKPRFAEMILTGAKSVELRRIAPSVPAGTLVVLYASSPTRAVVGTCSVADIQIGSRTAIWDAFRSECGVTRAEYRDYFDGASRAVAISVCNPQRSIECITLVDLRGRIDGFRPPQSFGYIDSLAAERMGLSRIGPSELVS